MKGLSDKLQFIYKRFLVIAVLFILLYTFVHWLFFIRAGFTLREDVLKFWLPIALPIIPVFLWLRPRVNFLKFKNENGAFGLQVLACLAIAFPTIVAQEYMITATGKLTQLENIAAFERSGPTKYYTLEKYFVDKQSVAFHSTASVSGKYNRYLNFRIYAVMPVRTANDDSSATEHRYWLGKKYAKQISNKISEAEKNEGFKSFAAEVQAEFDSTDFNRFSYLEVPGFNDDREGWLEAIKTNAPDAPDAPVVFEARSGSFAARNGNKALWTLGAFAIGALVWLAILLFPKFNEINLEHFKKSNVKKKAWGRATLQLYMPKEGFYITPIIMYVNLLLFILMVFAGLGFVDFNAGDLLQWGANYRPLTTSGQWWRLLSATFLHGGLMHLAANMYGLMYAGIFLEPILGRTRYLLLYLGSGIIASMASIWWYKATVSVGASGAIFGLYGFLIAALLCKVFPREIGKGFLISTSVFVGINLLMGLAGGIDNAAHIGGLASGLAGGFIMSGRLKKQADQTAIQQAALVVKALQEEEA
jgi:rhomboid protease GluP